MKTDFATNREGVGAWIEVREFSFGTFLCQVILKTNENTLNRNMGVGF